MNRRFNPTLTAMGSLSNKASRPQGKFQRAEKAELFPPAYPNSYNCLELGAQSRHKERLGKAAEFLQSSPLSILISANKKANNHTPTAALPPFLLLLLRVPDLSWFDSRIFNFVTV